MLIRSINQGLFMKIQSSYLRFFSALSIMLAAVSIHAAEIVAKSYDIKNVNEVVVTGGGRLELVQGDSESLRVEAEAEVMKRVVVDQSSSKLTLSVKTIGKGFNLFHWFDDNNDEVKYILQLKKLEYLGVSGASHATLGHWVGENIDVKASGAAEVTFNNLTLQDFVVELSGASNSRFQQLNTDKAKFKLSGAANLDVKATSQARFVKVDASGASNFRGKSLKAAQADVGASGASNIDVGATEFLKADASGASNIRYLGKPQLKSNASGASHIKAIND